MLQTKDIAVVILNWNGKSLLEQFLPSVLKHSNDAQIYVADNASTDDSVAFVSEHFPTVKSIQNTKKMVVMLKVIMMRSNKLKSLYSA